MSQPITIKNLPFIGQRFKRIGFRFEPDEKGRGVLVELNSPKRSIMFYGNRQVGVYGFPDGTFTSRKLTPRSAYKRKLGKFVYSRYGPVKITGAFPNFITNYGEPVFMDYDGSFCPFPVDFIGRLDEWFKHTVKYGINDEKVTPVFATGLVKIGVTVSKGIYKWSISAGSRILLSGEKDTAAGAEREAYKQAFDKGWKIREFNWGKDDHDYED